MVDKPRVRVRASGVPVAKSFTADSFQNVSASLGYGTANLSSNASYGLNTIGRNRIQLEWMYRGSWLVRKIVDMPAKDMTRAGIDIEGDMPPDDIKQLMQSWRQMGIWNKLRETIKWGRLFGGALAVIMIEGQDTATPLRTETVAKGAFKGLLVLDRWMVQASTTEFVTEFGSEFGMPKFYETNTTPSVPTMRIHHSRVIRVDGDDLPYQQRLAENGWGASIVEQCYDRMVAFDSATQGAAQLVYKAHLRTYSVAGLRDLIGAGGEMYRAFIESMQLLRQMQTNEGLTVIDTEDKLEYHTNSAFSGLSDALTQFGQQLSGACGIPLIILFGQSPSGFSSGESDIRNYYDNISSEQHSVLDSALTKLLAISYASEFGREVPEGTDHTFTPLWQQTEGEKLDNAGKAATAIMQVHGAGVISDKVALLELKQSSRETGLFTNISEEDIANASDAPPAPDMGGGFPPGDPNSPPVPGAIPGAPPEAPVAGLTPSNGAVDGPPPAPPSSATLPQKRPVSAPVTPPADAPPPGMDRVEGTGDIKVHHASGLNVKVNHIPAKE